MFVIRIQDPRIPAYRVIKGDTKEDVEAKAEAQLEVWNQRALARERKTSIAALRTGLTASYLAGAERATILTREAQSQIDALDGLLKSIVAQPIPSWQQLRDATPFVESEPAEPQPLPAPFRPNFDSFSARINLADRVMPWRRAAKERKAQEELDDAMHRWQEQASEVERLNKGALEKYADQKQSWIAKQDTFAAAKNAVNKVVDDHQLAYKDGNDSAIEFRVSEVLSRTILPANFQHSFDMSFSSQNATLIIDFELPTQSVLPEYREVRFVKAQSNFSFKPTSETWRKATYDSVLYQLALGVVFRIFAADESAYIHSVVFNGWVHSIDKTTGADAHSCILSLQAGRDEFDPLDLTRVDPKACFRSLKGVGSSKLAEMTPIKPIQQLNRQDDRFIAGYAVLEVLDERVNLAVMDWQDFENLIREVFEREFSHNGGEVRITRASRDGGVDAVAFDADPIRGGKIVIQAKRYTNTVGVSAVRDLYGTVQHEGAMKGILVTTATYGSDAYEFAKDKPLTLISGGELLSILERHGHKAKIDIGEARALRL